MKGIQSNKDVWNTYSVWNTQQQIFIGLQKVKRFSKTFKLSHLS